MADFVTADDRRIRDCTDFGINDLLLTDFFVTDRPGSVSARRQTVQRFVNLVSANIVKQQVTSGTGNPDNASGINGDMYFKIPLDSTRITLYFKSMNVWGLVFDLPIVAATGTQRIVKDRVGSDVTDYAIDFSTELDIPAFPDVTLFVNGGSNKSTLQYDQASKIVSGLPDVAPGDDLKFIFIG